MKIREEISHQLFAMSRPGYDFGRNQPVPIESVQVWIDGVKKAGVKSIICLLDQQHLGLYGSLPGGLLEYYRAQGFDVAHLPAADHQYPPLSADSLASIARCFHTLPKPILIHCSAGIDRTGLAVHHLKHLSP